MARVLQGTAVTTPTIRQSDPLADLNRLLSRLQQTVLRADADRERRLRTSEYERRKAETNIQYARSLLQKVEQDASTNKMLSRRPEWQGDFERKREVLEQLTDRMRDLQEISLVEDDESSDGEDILSEIIATPSESMDSRSANAPSEDLQEATEPEPVSPIPEIPEPSMPPPPAYEEKPRGEAPEQPISEKPPTQTSQSLRSRNPDPKKKEEKATSTSSALFGDRKDTGMSRTTVTEAILDSQRAEQDFLSESILKIARDLKDSSNAFASSLEQDKDIVGATGKGLDKNETGLEAAANRMGTLRKITEGKGWWGRMLLYAWIYGLMVALILLVFVLPKLRF